MCKHSQRQFKVKIQREDDHSGVGEGVRMLFHYMFLVNLGGSNEMLDL